MVGIVLVSHSYQLAEETIKLSLQMAQSEISVINAGGTSDGSFGTDPMRIMSAIGEADSGQGVLILLDIGSAIMSTEMAIEMSGVDASKVKIANAALVEGCIAGVTSASIGMTLDEVLTAAEEALSFPKVNR